MLNYDAFMQYIVDITKILKKLYKLKNFPKNTLLFEFSALERR